MPTISMRRKVVLFLSFIASFILILVFRLFYIQIVHGEFLQARAFEQQTRDRLIRPIRGNIYDRNGEGLALLQSAASISVIRAQIQDFELVAQTLVELLELDYDEVWQKINRRVALERIATHVPLEIANQFRYLDIDGIIIDEDIQRVYPFSTLAAQVIGFVGRDNQGIIGLEAKFDSQLQGQMGRILTETDAAGREILNSQIIRIDPIPGNSLITTLDVNIQLFAEQILRGAVYAKEAQRGAILVMNPQTGAILAMANEPSFDLNQPFLINDASLAEIWAEIPFETQMEHLNQMWRNFTINDTYEPGSTFKILTSAAGLNTGAIGTDTLFNCPGYRMIGGRQIRCWRHPRSHGTINFIEGVQNSCNPVFMDIAEIIGAEVFHQYMMNFEMNQKTGIDLPGEAAGIMYGLENIGPVELATMSFGQSFQITPLQMLRIAAISINGGYMITPHVVDRVIDYAGGLVQVLAPERGRQVISPETSDILRETLESVVYVGTGNRAYIPGYRIGGKTATSQKLPRGSRKYIASFIAFAPAENPEIIALVLIDEPQGVYYGGQVAGPIMLELLSNILPLVGIEPIFNEEELLQEGVGFSTVPDLANLTLNEAKRVLTDAGLEYEIFGIGTQIINQFPMAGESINAGSRVVIYVVE